MEPSNPPENLNNITVNVKFSGRSIPISVSPNTTIKDLKSILLPITNVLPRGQKLIFKGKVLVDSMTLMASGVTNGSKLMLMASQGLHQGDGPILKEARTLPINRRAEKEKLPISEPRSGKERWKATGIIALSESSLKEIPVEVWDCSNSGRVLDLNNNHIQHLPAQIGRLKLLEKLFLSANDMSDESISWEGIKSLKYLTVLSMNQNNLTTLPSTLGSLTSLRHLYVSNNKLSVLPDDIGLLTQLEVLRVNSNRISEIPTSIGNCNSLVEVDLSSNFLSELPESLSNLHKLKVLYLGNNSLKSLPSKLFNMCRQLSTLDLHNTEITIDHLRQFEGWDSFDRRRCLKLQKQLDFRLGDYADFDEGADKN